MLRVICETLLDRLETKVKVPKKKEGYTQPQKDLEEETSYGILDSATDWT